MVAQPWGSWFEYALPSDTVFVDSRIELFPSSVWEEYVAVRAGRVGWQDTLDRYGVDAIAFDPTDWPLADAIARDAGLARGVSGRGRRACTCVRAERADRLFDDLPDGDEPRARGQADRGEARAHPELPVDPREVGGHRPLPHAEPASRSRGR